MNKFYLRLLVHSICVTFTFHEPPPVFAIVKPKVVAVVEDPVSMYTIKTIQQIITLGLILVYVLVL